MATINKKLIHFERLADFEARLSAGDIQSYSIVCIKDAKLIWTHGTYYGDMSDVLLKTGQSLTDEEKIQVKQNLGLDKGLLAYFPLFEISDDMNLNVIAEDTVSAEMFTYDAATGNLVFNYV